MRLIILEDNDDRQRVMKSVLSDRFPQFGVEFFESVPPMIEHLERTGLYDVALISLDHDLEIIPGPDGASIDPGNGVDAARWFERQPVLAPLIVHTTNTFAGDRMVDILLPAGWKCERVVPYCGEDWIGEAWFPLVRKLVVAHGLDGSMAETGLQILKCHWRLGDGAYSVVRDCLRAARHRMAGDRNAEGLSLDVLFLGFQGRLPRLLHGKGIFGNFPLGQLQAEFEGDEIDAGPRSLSESHISATSKIALKEMQVRELQIEILHVPTAKPMPTRLLVASLSDRHPLDTHRMQETLAQLRSLIELSLAYGMRRTAPTVPKSAKPAPKIKGIG